MAKPRVPVQTTLDQTEYELLTRLAAEQHTSNAALIRRLVRIAVGLESATGEALRGV